MFTTLWPVRNLEVFRTELAVLAETLSYHISHDVSSASSRSRQVLRRTFKSNRLEKLTRHTLPSFSGRDGPPLGMGNIIKKDYQTPIYWHSSYRQIIVIERNTFGDYQKIIDIEKRASNFIRWTWLKALFQKQERKCFISKTNMKLSLKTVNKVA